MNDIDPPKTRSLAARSTTDGLTKKQRQRQERQAKAQEQKKISIPVESQKIDVSKVFTEETKYRRFAKQCINKG